jgi:hypothetical protein
MDIHQAKTEAGHEELMAAMKASQERTIVLMDVNLETMEASIEKIELNQGKRNQDGSCVEEKNVESMRGLEDQSKVSILTDQKELKWHETLATWDL